MKTIYKFSLAAYAFSSSLGLACTCPSGYVPKMESPSHVSKMGSSLYQASQAAATTAAKADATAQILGDTNWASYQYYCTSGSPSGILMRGNVTPIVPSDLSCGEDSGMTWGCTITMEQYGYCCIPSMFE